MGEHQQWVRMDSPANGLDGARSYLDLVNPLVLHRSVFAWVAVALVVVSESEEERDEQGGGGWVEGKEREGRREEKRRERWLQRWGLGYCKQRSNRHAVMSCPF